MGFRGVFILLSVSMITMYSCVLGRDTAKSGISEITFGSGGGVTGRVVLYRLKPNGTVYNDNNERVTKLDRLKPITINYNGRRRQRIYLVN